MSDRRIESSKPNAQSTADPQLRAEIIEEARIRRLIGRLDDIRRDHPDTWRSLEERRLQSNHNTATTNQRLAAAGMSPMSLEPSLAQLRQKLKRLERRNAAAIAALQRAAAGSRSKRSGTPLASGSSRQKAKEGR